jgi:hypothetical protein
MIIWYPFNPLYYNGTPSRSNAALSIVKVLSHGAALLERRSFLCRYHREDFSWLLTVAKHDLFFLHVSKVSKQYGWNMMKSINNINKLKIQQLSTDKQLELTNRSCWTRDVPPNCCTQSWLASILAVYVSHAPISPTSKDTFMGIAMPKYPRSPHKMWDQMNQMHTHTQPPQQKLLDDLPWSSQLNVRCQWSVMSVSN